LILALIAVITSTSLFLLANRSQPGTDGSNEPASTFATKLSPKAFNLPDSIAGYPLLAVITLKTDFCMMSGSARVVLQTAANEDIPSTFRTDAVLQELATYHIDGIDRWEINVVGGPTSLDQIAASLLSWNEANRNGCMKLAGPIKIQSEK
ncbi:MAG TPA: hypothetical protein VHL11_21430, partial [Phototrophicaceae bacterium]|nr:hypothetical protein [Phototrophicaceae bacterium]